MSVERNTRPKKLLLVANVVKEHVLKFHIPTIKALKARGWTVDVAASGEEGVPFCDRQIHGAWKRSLFTLDTLRGVYQLRSIMQSVTLQAMKTAEFLALMKHLRTAGLTPCVVKGIVCRSLYPQPDHRGSGDEDVLIPQEQFAKCHEAMLALGMKPSDPQMDIQSAYAAGKAFNPIYYRCDKSMANQKTACPVDEKFPEAGLPLVGYPASCSFNNVN